MGGGRGPGGEEGGHSVDDELDPAALRARKAYRRQLSLQMRAREQGSLYSSERMFLSHLDPDPMLSGALRLGLPEGRRFKIGQGLAFTFSLWKWWLSLSLSLSLSRALQP